VLWSSTCRRPRGNSFCRHLDSSSLDSRPSPSISYLTNKRSILNRYSVLSPRASRNRVKGSAAGAKLPAESNLFAYRYWKSRNRGIFRTSLPNPSRVPTAAAVKTTGFERAPRTVRDILVEHVSRFLSNLSMHHFGSRISCGDYDSSTLNFNHTLNFCKRAPGQFALKTLPSLRFCWSAQKRFCIAYPETHQTNTKLSTRLFLAKIM
jgi:hypothetical protein